MKLSTHLGIGVLLLTAGLALASAEELVGTPVAPGEDTTLQSEPMLHAQAPMAATPDMPPSANQDWHKEMNKELKDAFADMKHHDEWGDFHDDGHFEPALLIPIFVVIFIFGGPLILVGFFIAQRYRAKALRQENLNLNIDKLLAAGRDIPVELLRGDEPISAEESGDLNKGIRNLFWGIGLLTFLTIFAGIKIGAVGFIWIALGLSQMTIWKLNSRQTPVQSELQD